MKHRGRPRSFSEEELLVAGIQLFERRGYFGASMDDVCREAGVAKPSVYALFPSKEQFYLACLKHHIVNSDAKKCLSKEPAGWNNIRAFLRCAIQHNQTHSGDLILSAMRDRAFLPAEAQDIIAEYWTSVRQAVINNAKERLPKQRTHSFSEMILLLFLGMSITTSIQSNDDVEIFLDAMT